MITTCIAIETCIIQICYLYYSHWIDKPDHIYCECSSERQKSERYWLLYSIIWFEIKKKENELEGIKGKILVCKTIAIMHALWNKSKRLLFIHLQQSAGCTLAHSKEASHSIATCANVNYHSCRIIAVLQYLQIGIYGEL